MTQEAWRPNEQPVARSFTMQALVPGGHPVTHVSVLKPLPAGTDLFASAQLAAEVQRAVAAERERCAAVAETCDVGPCPNVPKQRQMIAAAIRKAQP